MSRALSGMDSVQVDVSKTEYQQENLEHPANRGVYLDWNYPHVYGDGLEPPPYFD